MTHRTQRHLLAFAVTLLASASAVAQVSLSSAVGLAYKASPKVQSAAADALRARAALSESKDAFVPVVGAEGGVGRSSGVPTGLPVIFTMSAHSLVFNWSQRDYIRAAHFGWDASQLALQQAQLDTAEDVATTYIALDNAQQRHDAATAAVEHARKLLGIVQDRVNAGQDAHIEVPRTDLQLTQMQMKLAHIDSEVAELSDHLARVTGLSTSQLSAVHNTIPPLPTTAAIADEAQGQPTLPEGIQAAFVTARAKYETARGDARYLYRPQVSLAANYSRITTDFSNYALYYPAFSSTYQGRNGPLSLNSLALGIEIQLPILDQAHRAAARQSAAEALKAKYDAEVQRDTFLESRLKLQHSANDLDLNTRIAQDQADIAQDELNAILVQLNAAAPAGPNAQPLTPKDEQSARLGMDQRRLDLLDAELQLAQTKIILMRQNGALAVWLNTVATP
jgi:outer membrane protein TolC